MALVSDVRAPGRQLHEINAIILNSYDLHSFVSRSPRLSRDHENSNRHRTRAMSAMETWFSLWQYPESFNGLDERYEFMAAKSSKAQPATPGLLLKRLLEDLGLEQDETARRSDISLKQLWRVFNVEGVLDMELARQIADPCGIRDAAADELFTAVRKAAAKPKSAEEPNPAQKFGKYLGALRRSKNPKIRRLAKEWELPHSNLLAMESGRTVPSPLMGARIAAKLQLSPEQAAEYFRLLGDALLERSAVSKCTSVPALCSLAEWVLFTQARTALKAASVCPVSRIPNVENTIQQVQAALAEAGRQFEAQARNLPGATASPLMAAWISRADGKTTLMLPVTVTL
jgi:transcriptional regulator with XRE-family HTH domain